MDRSARRLFACLVVSPLGLIPIAGCGNSDSQPAAHVESEQGTPPLFISRGEQLRAIPSQAENLPPRATLAERVVLPESPRRLPPVESLAQDAGMIVDEGLSVADARYRSASSQSYQIIPLPPVTETSLPADDTQYLASRPQSVVVDNRPLPADASPSPTSDDLSDDFAELDWPEEEQDAPQNKREAAKSVQVEDVETPAQTDSIENRYANPRLELNPPAELDSQALEVDEPGSEYDVRPLPAVVKDTSGNSIQSENKFSQPIAVPQDKPAPQASPALTKVESSAPTRSQAMRVVSEQAAVHVKKGMSLASRGAHYSARSEFILALRVISQALDVANNTHDHTEALSAGLRALEEADDFVPRGTQLEADLNLPALVHSHRTPVLKNADPDSLRPLIARQQYYTYAQEQLALSAKGDRSGSMALYGLAKMRATLAAQQGDMAMLELPKAMALYQASLISDGDNYMASNELGVLLARYGQYESARSLLEHSVKVQPQAASWHNLSVVYHHLGQSAEVAQAKRMSAALAQAQRANPSAHSEVVWKPVDEFSRTTSKTQAPVAQKPANKHEQSTEKR